MKGKGTSILWSMILLLVCLTPHIKTFSPCTENFSVLFAEGSRDKKCFCTSGNPCAVKEQDVSQLDRHTSGNVSLEQGLAKWLSSFQRVLQRMQIEFPSPTQHLETFYSFYSRGSKTQACTWYAFIEAGKIFIHIKINKSWKNKTLGLR